MTDNMFNSQLELENIAQAAGINRYRNGLAIRGQENTQPGQRLLTMNAEAMTPAVSDWMEAVLVRKAGRRNSSFSLISAMQPAQLAFLTVSVAIKSVEAGAAITALSKRIGTAVSMHQAWMQLETNHKGLAVVVGRQLESVASESHRRGVLSKVLSIAGVSTWSEKQTVSVGRMLIELLLDSTNLLKQDEPYMSKGRKSTSTVSMSDETMAYLNAGHERCEILSPINKPMVTPPQAWTTPWDGGYLTVRVGLIRRGEFGETAPVAPMPSVYRAVNALQATAYSVNTAVLDVLTKVWDEGSQLAGIPAPNNEPLPAKPAIMEGDAKQDWKMRATAIHGMNIRERSRRLSVMRTLGIAKQYQHYDAIYFPHNLDWRGRAYPVPSDLQPQGDDFAKSLLQLSDGIAVGEEGRDWVHIHLAGLFGVDKVSMADRLTWVRSNRELIIDSALDPLDGERFWTTADKPWQALAACIEYVRIDIHGVDYESKLVVSVDGSCNGLQHLSAMLRDSIGGSAVNLVPADVPQDVYTQVMESTLDKVDAAPGDNASQWFDEHPVNRLLVKRAVMTKPYGVTPAGMRNQIEDLMVSKKSAHHHPDITERKTLSAFITPLVDDSISELVVASSLVMDWFKKVSKIVAKAGKPLVWVSPSGMQVTQDYRKQGTERVIIRMFGKQRQFRLGFNTEEINVRKQTVGTSPNVVHSFDAAHMMMTICDSLDVGLSDFVMVHDSYGTHAANITALNALLRNAFVNIYNNDVLADLEQQFKAQVSPEVADTFPELPPMGTLDINSVLDSTYFFA